MAQRSLFQATACSVGDTRPERAGLLVGVEHFGCDVRPGETLGALARGGGHPRASSRIRCQRSQALGQRQGVPRRNEQSVEAVADDIAVARDVRREHRRRGRERLRQNHAKALPVQRRRAQHVRAR
jgi:hypothetical protein